MATGILMPGATVANPIDIIPPPIANLNLWVYFGGSLAQSINAGNAGALAPGAGSGVTYSPHYASFHGFTGSLAPPAYATTPSQTILVASRYIGGGTSGSAGLLLQLANLNPSLSETLATLNLQGNGTLGTATNLTFAPANSGGSWKFMAHTTQSGGPHMLYDLTGNTQQIASSVGAELGATQLVGIGGPPTATGTNDRGVDIAFIAHAQTVLTKPQIDAQYAAVKATLAQFGIVV